MTVLALTGAGTPLGRRVRRSLSGEGSEPTEILELDGLDDVRRKEALGGVDAVVLLANGAGTGEPGTALADIDRVLDAAADAGVDHVVLVSSALVYGASADNPIPLPEDTPLRPDPEVGWAVELAEAERRSAEWADRSGKPLAILRPALIADPEGDDFLVRALGGIDAVRAAGESRPVQFVHIDDLAAAVTLAVRRRLDGTFNVAPDGWVDDSEAAALAGAVLPRPGLPARLVDPLRRLAWRVGLGATPPAMSAYADHPWVVAADRLLAEGWQPTHTNEEVLVVTTKGSALAELSPRKRQELLLAIAGVLGVGVIVGAVLVIRRALRSSAS